MNNRIGVGMMAALGLLCAPFIIFMALTDPLGGVSAATRFLGIAGLLIALINPRLGVLVVIFEGCYFDLLKRLAVYFGGENFLIVTQIVAIPVITAVAVGLGGILQRLRVGKLQPRNLVIYGVSCVLIGAFFVATKAGGQSILQSLRQAGLMGAFLLLIPALDSVVTDPKDMMRLFRQILWMFIPVAIYGCWQRLHGFSAFEIAYAQTGFTVVANEMFSEVPRPFSTMNSGTSYSLVGFCAVLALYFALLDRDTRARWWYLLLALLFGYAMIISLYRTSTLLMVAAAFIYPLLLRRWSTVAFYSMFVVFLGVIVLSADFLLQNMDDLNAVWLDQFGGRTAERDKAFSIATASERLYGFRSWTDPEWWTLTGIGGENEALMKIPGSKFYNHDFLSQVLLQFGGPAFIAMFIAAGAFAWTVHRKLLKVSSPTVRSFCAMLLAYWIPGFGAMVLGGNGLAVFPLNAMFYISMASVLIATRTVAAREVKEMKSSPLVLVRRTLPN